MYDLLRQFVHMDVGTLQSITSSESNRKLDSFLSTKVIKR